MEPIPYDKSQMMNVELVSEEGTHYIGEYIDMRISRQSIPEGKYAYDCRHDDDGDWVTPVTIERYFVMVNFAGVFITDTPVIFPEKQNHIPLKDWDMD